MGLLDRLLPPSFAAAAEVAKANKKRAVKEARDAPQEEPLREEVPQEERGPPERNRITLTEGGHAPGAASSWLSFLPLCVTRQLERFNGFGQAPGQETQYTQYTRDFAQDSSSAFDSRPPTNTTGKFGQGNTVPQSAFMGQTTRHAQMLS